VVAAKQAQLAQEPHPRRRTQSKLPAQACAHGARRSPLPTRTSARSWQRLATAAREATSAALWQMRRRLLSLLLPLLLLLLVWVWVWGV
jgi:hypothetical protein